jgi:outer membrane lipoprotein SlyB
MFDKKKRDESSDVKPEHHSKLKGAAVGGAAGDMIAGKKGAAVGAGLGALRQHKKNEREEK